MKSHFRENLVKGFAVAGVAWASLFLWCVITTVYADHMSLAAKTVSLDQQVRSADQRQKDAVLSAVTPLDEKLADLKQGCAKTEGANEALERQTSSQQDTINNCQTQALKLLAPEPFKVTPVLLDPAKPGIDLHTPRWILLTNRTVTPVDLLVRCNKRIIGISGQVLGSASSIQIGGNDMKLADNEHELSISSPAWSPVTPLLATVSYSGGEFITCNFAER